MKRDTENLDPRGMLAHFDRAKLEVQAAASLAAAKTYRDKAKAVQSYAKLAKDRELLERATDLQLSAERRMGELLAEMEATGEKATGKGHHGGAGRGSKRATLASLGITKDEGARAKRLAEPPPEVFEQALTDAKKLGKLTHAAVIKHATKREVQRKRAQGSWPFRGNWTDSQIAEASAWFDGLPDGADLKHTMAAAGCTQNNVFSAMRYCANASPAYLRTAVKRAVRPGGDAAMLYGERPPGDALGRHIFMQIHEFEQFPTDNRREIVLDALRKANQQTDALRTAEEERWKELYGQKSATSAT